MKKTAKLAREIEHAQAKIALLCQEQARIGQEISHLVATNKAKMMELVGATVERWDLSQVPVQALLSSLSKLSQDVVHDRPNLADVANIQTFVRFGRNASASNRQRLEAAGLHWNGREGGWVGKVTETELAVLRHAFGARVEKPEHVRAEDNSGMSPEDAQGALSADVEAMVTSAEERQGQAATAAPEEQFNAMATLRPSSFGFPLRRPTLT
ncbi:hypothetical protein [Bradyrhizobium sp. Ash2021]|uniref:hypothetical protein n=1 Tax=Bradyrhizobium sp. Ash2021 TaxID=2954771 RepID=UPI002815F87A|nr:hypothetical protein [Bradyrhizobium sp. Ash2021]WMT76976.1 hypothetical protein NL528_11770 [Bradyrhizobium sp. Ash2021]